MSDVMLFGVLRMPYELAMSDELSRRQFYQRAQEAADRLAAAAVPNRFWVAPDVPSQEMVRCAEMWDDGFTGMWARARTAALSGDGDSE